VLAAISSMQLVDANHNESATQKGLLLLRNISYSIIAQEKLFRFPGFRFFMAFKFVPTSIGYYHM